MRKKMPLDFSISHTLPFSLISLQKTYWSPGNNKHLWNQWQTGIFYSILLVIEKRKHNSFFAFKYQLQYVSDVNLFLSNAVFYSERSWICMIMISMITWCITYIHNFGFISSKKNHRKGIFLFQFRHRTDKKNSSTVCNFSFNKKCFIQTPFFLHFNQ